MDYHNFIEPIGLLKNGKGSKSLHKAIDTVKLTDSYSCYCPYVTKNIN